MTPKKSVFSGVCEGVGGDFLAVTRSRKNYQYRTEGQKLHENSAPVLVIISGNSLVFSRKIITSTGFYRYCAADASAPVVVINQAPSYVT